MHLGRAAIRGLIGPLFIGHGTQKLFGWFGGHGLEATGGAFESMGFKPGKRHAAAAGATEAIGGALITAGALTPLGAAMISGTMVTAIRKVHASNGPWVTEGGFEYNAVLLGAMAAITELGPGSPSVDAKRFPGLKGTSLALLQLAAGVAGSYLITSPALNEAAGANAEQTADTAGDPAPAPQQATNGRHEPELATA
jgi:putative oxidoreductase